MIVRLASHRVGRRAIAVLLVAGVRLALHTAPARTLRTLHQSCNGSPRRANRLYPRRVDTLRQLAESIDRGARMMSGPFDFAQGGTCLVSALASCVAARLLRTPVRLRLGVHQVRPDLRAHAWVECAGAVLASGASSLAFDR